MELCAGSIYGSLKVIGCLPTRTSKGERQWVVMCLQCNENSLKKSTDLNRGRINCPHCRAERSVEAPIRDLFSRYKRSASLRGRTFEIPFDQFKQIIFQNCFYCQISPFATHTKIGMKHSITYNGLDRVNNSLGYTIDNVVACCKFCNLAKKTFTVEEFCNWLNQIKNCGEDDG